MKQFIYSFIAVLFLFGIIYGSSSRKNPYPKIPELEAELDQIYYQLDHLEPKDIWLHDEQRLYLGSDRTNYIIFKSTGIEFYIDNTLEGYLDSTGFVDVN